MEQKSDAQLLREYAKSGNEIAFRGLVDRYTDMVYSSASRQVASSAAACDIAQSVFTDLASKACSLANNLPGEASLTGWLHRSTRYAALNHLRDERRRHTREQQAMERIDSPCEAAAPDWDALSPILDEVLCDLRDEDRDALLLRYFKNNDFRTIGQSLGVSDDAAQKRVTRALEKLRAEFARRGVTTTAVALSAAFNANAVTAAPAGLAATLSTTACASTAIAVTKTIAMTLFQKILITTVLTAAIGAGIYEASQASNLSNQNQLLEKQKA